MVDRKVVVAAAAKSLPAVAGPDLETITSGENVWRSTFTLLSTF